MASERDGKSKGNGKDKKLPPINTSIVAQADVGDGPPTGSSVYSCTDLDKNHPYHHLNAADVRRQTKDAPSGRAVAPEQWNGMTKYPQGFQNKEQIQGLQSKEPRKEYPVVLGKGTWDQASTGRSGPARIIFSPDPDNRDKFDVVYHSSKKPGQNDKDIKLAQYRPSKA
ncbi:hypothetical protein F4814DRAFT_460799 [Daldinia grandis]|nr:hypothetical protein F4814DRAFT_460799 [Daldinia grandis]